MINIDFQSFLVDPLAASFAYLNGLYFELSVN